ncbi:hypothetical protein D3C73_993020 [compost metagenome]
MDVQRADHREVFALVIQTVQFAWVEKLARRPVAHERILLIRVPQALDHLDVFGRPAVAGVVIIMFVATVIASGAGIAAGDDVPARTAFADQVQ